MSATDGLAAFPHRHRNGLWCRPAEDTLRQLGQAISQSLQFLAHTPDPYSPLRLDRQIQPLGGGFGNPPRAISVY